MLSRIFVFMSNYTLTEKRLTRQLPSVACNFPCLHGAWRPVVSARIPLSSAGLKRTRVVRVKRTCEAVRARVWRMIMRCKGTHKRKKEEQYSLTYSAPVRLHRALPMGQSFLSVPVKILIQNAWKTKTSHLKVLLVYCNWVHFFFTKMNLFYSS